MWECPLKEEGKLKKISQKKTRKEFGEAAGGAALKEKEKKKKKKAW